MNKYQEALDHLKTVHSSNNYYKRFNISWPIFEKDIALLQELIDKETPNDGPCASCVSNNKKRGHKDIKYCPNCGQRIDWSEDE